ncbi:hypothetical protein ABIA32_006704 [Streptacidiphilus sp. MAP12-20]|uniref:hypothetical protein n=1 Tax=Streptacidiphilus sp. MAP12-20 TaxID=3156299 RepID=UPI00351478B3
MSFPLAHERYGGIPRPEEAQVLVNTRGDGAPGIILATPPTPAKIPGKSGGDCEVESHVFHVLNASVIEFLNEFPECGEASKILIHLEASAIDRKDLSAALRGVLKLLEQSLPVGSA